jgi:hypothetical protein
MWAMLGDSWGIKLIINKNKKGFMGGRKKD